jgi:hypothetical protein
MSKLRDASLLDTIPTFVTSTPRLIPPTHCVTFVSDGDGVYRRCEQGELQGQLENFEQSVKIDSVSYCNEETVVTTEQPVSDSTSPDTISQLPVPTKTMAYPTDIEEQHQYLRRLQEQQQELAQEVARAQEQRQTYRKHERSPEQLSTSLDPDEQKLVRLFKQLSNTCFNELTLAPEKFDGTFKDVDRVEKWVKHFERYATLKNIDTTTQLNVFKMLLTGQAADWLNSLPDNDTATMDNLKAAFRRRYALTELHKLHKLTQWQRNQLPTVNIDIIKIFYHLSYIPHYLIEGIHKSN